jgi:hypothetical protein
MMFRRWAVLEWWVPNGGAGEAEYRISSRHWFFFTGARRCEDMNFKTHYTLSNRVWYTVEQIEEKEEYE